MVEGRIPSRRLRIAFAVGVAAAAAAAGIHLAAEDYERPGPSTHAFSKNFDLVGYHDLDGRPAFKLALQVVDGRWYLYASHFWDRGWSVLDVTNPATPELLAFVSGPDNTATLQVQVAGALMLTSLERPATELLHDASWAGLAWLARRSLIEGPPFRPWREVPAGVIVWSLADPAHPKRLGAWDCGGTGTHRNFYAGGRYAHLAANKPGFRGHQYVILDLADPTKPVEAGHWFLPDQEIASDVVPAREGYYLHGPAVVVGNHAYLPYGIGGAVVLDISDVAHPRELGRLELDSSLGSVQGVHSFVPIPERRLAIVNSEAHAEDCKPDPGRTFAAVVDLTDEARPRLVSFFPEPEVPPEAPYASFCERGGRAGSHNQHHDNGLPQLFHSDHLTYIAHFNAGLRLYDTSDPLHVREIAYFVPPDPTRRFGVFPTRLVAQSEDVIVDARGYAYFTDKNQGLYVVRARFS